MNHGDALPIKFTIDIDAADMDAVSSALVLLAGRASNQAIQEGVQTEGVEPTYAFKVFYENNAPLTGNDNGEGQ